MVPRTMLKTMVLTRESIREGFRRKAVLLVVPEQSSHGCGTSPKPKNGDMNIHTFRLTCIQDAGPVRSERLIQNQIAALVDRKNDLHQYGDCVCKGCN